MIEFWGLFWSGGIDVSLVLLYLFLFTGVILGGLVVKPILGQKDEIYKSKRDFANLKTNMELFEMSLLRSKKIKSYPLGIGILLNVEEPKHENIKVRNPYCGPCARVHPKLESLFIEGI